MVASGLWGLAGGVVVEALELASEIRKNKNRWPWTKKTRWPAIVAIFLRLAASCLLASAMSGALLGIWPAFCLGVSAPLAVARIAQQTPRLEKDVPGGADS